MALEVKVLEAALVVDTACSFVEEKLLVILPAALLLAE